MTFLRRRSPSTREQVVEIGCVTQSLLSSLFCLLVSFGTQHLTRELVVEEAEAGEEEEAET